MKIRPWFFRLYSIPLFIIIIYDACVSKIQLAVIYVMWWTKHGKTHLTWYTRACIFFETTFVCVCVWISNNGTLNHLPTQMWYSCYLDTITVTSSFIQRKFLRWIFLYIIDESMKRWFKITFDFVWLQSMIDW